MTVKPAAYSNSIGALRTWLVLLVVAHHAALAYLPEAPPVAMSLVAAPRWWQAFPIVDCAKWAGASLFTSFNDTFFMAALFLVSGLFVWQGLESKGPRVFLQGRLVRLGIPFLVMALIVAPAAYLASYVQIHAVYGGSGFWHQWHTLGSWPAGPGWFLWVLLMFDCITAVTYVLCPVIIDKAGMLVNSIGRHAVVVGLFILLTMIAYVPMALHIGATAWFSFAFFSAQTSRLMLYFVYFLLGVGLGNTVLKGGNVDRLVPFTRLWPLWTGVALGAFALVVVTAIAAMMHLGRPAGWTVLAACAFCLSCAFSTVWAFALAVRFGQRAGPLWRRVQESSFGIYVVHYGFVVWAQCLLLHIQLPGLVKFAIVTLTAVLLSFLTIQLVSSVANVPSMIVRYETARRLA